MKRPVASQAPVVGREGESASERISKRIVELGDWRGETLSQIRAVIKEADPDILAEWKWMGTPVWKSQLAPPAERCREGFLPRAS